MFQNIGSSIVYGAVLCTHAATRTNWSCRPGQYVPPQKKIDARKSADLDTGPAPAVICSQLYRAVDIDPVTSGGEAVSAKKKVEKGGPCLLSLPSPTASRLLFCLILPQQSLNILAVDTSGPDIGPTLFDEF